jgi:hypothetical protein
MDAIVNKFKYRPEVKSIEDLQPGDEFLVGEQKWYWDGQLLGINGSKNDVWGGGLTLDLIRANVPIERDIPYPEGGAEKWELREGDGEWIKPKGVLFWDCGEWHEVNPGFPSYRNHEYREFIYAIPKPQDKAKPAPKEYTVGESVAGYNGCLWLGPDFKPGDRVTVQRVES